MQAVFVPFSQAQPFYCAQGQWDEATYLTLHADVAIDSQSDGFSHYRLQGHSEGRKIGIKDSCGNIKIGVWSDEKYLQVNSDVKDDAWSHYIPIGRSEGKNIVIKKDNDDTFQTLFYARGKWDEATYLKLHPDVAKDWQWDGFYHYKLHGHSERRKIGIKDEYGRIMTGFWSGENYLAIWPEVKEDAWSHYASTGFEEKRDIVIKYNDTCFAYSRGKWDEATYLKLHPDVAKNWQWDGFYHYKLHGHSEGREIGVKDENGDIYVGLWSATKYLEMWPGLKTDVWTYYIDVGHAKNTDIAVMYNEIIPNLSYPQGKWDEITYLKLHPDVAKNWQWDGFYHYKLHGHSEGREIGIKDASGNIQVGFWSDEKYLELWPDVKDDPWKHYSEVGHAENRDIAIKQRPPERDD